MLFVEKTQYNIYPDASDEERKKYILQIISYYIKYFYILKLLSYVEST